MANDELSNKNQELEHQVTDIRELVKDLENCSKASLLEAKKLKDDLEQNKNK